MSASLPTPVTEPPVTPAPPRVAEVPPAAASDAGDLVLDIRNLRTYFFTYDGVVKALDGVTFNVRRGETVGLVGETGCGKSVTAFSVTRLIPDPPGRIMDGTIRFKGANLLWGIEREARYRPVPKTNRVKVTRRYRFIRQAQERMTAVRGGGISMIFQEPTSALNPIFSVSDQISEALVLHRGTEIIARLLQADRRIREPSTHLAVEAAFRESIKAARDDSGESLRAAVGRIGEAVGLPSLATQAYYLLRPAWSNPESKLQDLRAMVRRVRLSTLQRGHLNRQRKLIELQARLKELYLSEMRDGRLHLRERRIVQSRRLPLRLAGIPSRFWGVSRHVAHPLKEETFWLTVGLLEGVSIANPSVVARGFPHELSGGMLQRVMIAMALSSEPELLMADEPTTALDVTIQAQILDLMRNLKERVGTAILLITHDLGVIAEVADRVCVMYAGNVVENGPVGEIFSRPLHPYTQGLLHSIPRLDDPSKQLESIPGSVPNLIYPPTGCRFHPRCPYAMPVCKEARPPMTVEGTEHTVACYLYHGPKAGA